MELKDYTTKELEKELENRKIPEMLEEQNSHRVTELCVEYINNIVQTDGRPDDDFEHYIFEAAMKMVYGRDIFTWINAKLK